MSQLLKLAQANKAGLQSRDVSTWGSAERRLLAACHPKQRDFVEDPGRRVVALVARGGGKTTGAKARLIRRMLNTPRAATLFIATTRGAAEELMWNPLKDTLEQLGIEARFNETKLKCTLTKNGSVLRLVGADDKREIEKLRGIPHHEVGIDEGASYKTQLLDHLLFRILGPRMGDFENSTIFIIGTPGHILAGPFYEASREGSEIARPYTNRQLPEYENWGRWSKHSWNLLDGAKTIPAMARLWTEALREKEANGWSDEHPVWRREYLGHWAADDTSNMFRYRPHDLETGELYNQWDPAKDKYGVAVLPEIEGADWHHVLAMDMGHSDPFSLQVFAWNANSARPKLYHRYEFSKKGMYARTIAELLLGEKLDAQNPGGIIAAIGGWPDGMAADIAGLGGAMLDELANVYGIRVLKADKRDKFDNIELFNGDLLEQLVYILANTELEKQLASLQWAEDEWGQLREMKGVRNDATDAAIYARRLANHLFGKVEAVKESLFHYDGWLQEEQEEEAPGGEFDMAPATFNDDWG